ncbi:hypothetical protein BDV95DRAFT_612872 [Massariosphaeria phaeospora]|uniref:ZZ-type domain-containing protein n=1 Tax=Massariosphaeria phaeospora TaxID=100035 RepID=A0A7C8I1A3_9PLEO|nr:hypothetical protein BDV95DRAFT_612872 [Massariosphaeria phaeospora]
MATSVPVTLDTLIVVKVQFQGVNKKYKIPLRDLGAQVFPDKLRSLLELKSDDVVVFERYSDSAGSYVTLDSDKPQVYKTLFRAAKAKLKLRLKATILGQEEPEPTPAAPLEELTPAPPASSLHRMSTDTLTPQAVAQVSPVIAHSPMPPPTVSTYKKPQVESEEASPVSPLANKAEVEDEAEAPVPRSFTARKAFFHGLANASRNTDLAFRPKEVAPQCSWVVYCNSCNKPMDDAHFHCSICDHGDYDLCPSCVGAGVHCPGAGHWMVKRSVKNGCVVNSTTERVGPKTKPETEQEMPGAFTDEKQPVVVAEQEEPTRTCNSCVKVLPEKEFVTCIACEDYDLCLECHVSNKHGHHPGHAFKAATPETVLPALADFLCNTGRNVRHSAVCDGCEKFIYGVRHKCLNCPDWDFCSECIKSAKFIHPRHRFVPIYEPLAEPATASARHYGIYCDGPLCKDKESLSYIEGVRYKCAVCHDTDFCANCEAMPSNRHNRTHPLIKFKIPVRSVTVTTLNEDKNGQALTRVGDREPARKSTATETTPVPSTNAATQVQTILNIKPTDQQQPMSFKEKIEIRDLLAGTPQERIPLEDMMPTAPAKQVNPVKAEPVAVPKARSINNEELDAHFVRDTIEDGTKICAGHQFIQVWTMRNPGPNTWPSGCSVRHIGGDNMLNLDNTQPLSQSELADASESNVLGRSVEPGEERSFRVVMKAPRREGTAISYWRLKKADGTPFGHRLWCDIQVVAPFTPAPAPMPAPASAELAETPALTSSAPRLNTYDYRMSCALFESRKRASALRRRVENAKGEDVERTARLQEEAIERLRKMRVQFGEKEKEDQGRLLEKMEREKTARIQKLRKAAIERLLDSRRKEQDATLAALQQQKVEMEASAVPVKQETAELPVEEKPVEPQTQPQGSGMIFPQLDKESPASSTHEAIIAQPESPKSDTTIPATASEQSDEEFFEDAESVEIRSMSSDDGFMTDEEYDILDASDEEMP